MLFREQFYTRLQIFVSVWNICKKLWNIYKKVSPYVASQLSPKWLSFYFNKLSSDGDRITITIYILSWYELSLIEANVLMALSISPWHQAYDVNRGRIHNTFLTEGTKTPKNAVHDCVLLFHTLYAVFYILFVSRSLQSLNFPFLSNIWPTFKPNFNMLIFYSDASFPSRYSSDWLYRQIT